jgi:hypothetical protein
LENPPDYKFILIVVNVKIRVMFPGAFRTNAVTKISLRMLLYSDYPF